MLYQVKIFASLTLVGLAGAKTLADCPNCGGEIQDTTPHVWFESSTERYCMQPECAHAARKAAFRKSRYNPTRLIAVNAKQKELERLLRSKPKARLVIGQNVARPQTTRNSRKVELENMNVRERMALIMNLGLPKCDRNKEKQVLDIIRAERDAAILHEQRLKWDPYY